MDTDRPVQRAVLGSVGATVLGLVLSALASDVANDAVQALVFASSGLVIVGGLVALVRALGRSRTATASRR